MKLNLLIILLLMTSLVTAQTIIEEPLAEETNLDVIKVDDPKPMDIIQQPIELTKKIPTPKEKKEFEKYIDDNFKDKLQYKKATVENYVQVGNLKIISMDIDGQKIRLISGALE